MISCKIRFLNKKIPLTLSALYKAEPVNPQENFVVRLGTEASGCL